VVVVVKNSWVVLPFEIEYCEMCMNDYFRVVCHATSQSFPVWNGLKRLLVRNGWTKQMFWNAFRKMASVELMMRSSSAILGLQSTRTAPERNTNPSPVSFFSSFCARTKDVRTNHLKRRLSQTLSQTCGTECDSHSPYGIVYVMVSMQLNRESATNARARATCKLIGS
jgi:hypothetical protein